MLITKFNKMIRNRVVWSVIGGIVIITFVGWFSPRGGCATDDVRSAAGQEKGRIGADELARARYHVYLGFCMRYGRMIPVTPELDREIHDQALRRAAALRMAEELGLMPSDQEVLDAIQRDPNFQENGAFSKARFQTFVRGFLANLGGSSAQYEEFTRENVALQKLQNMVGAAAWVAPAEVERAVATFADTFVLKYSLLDESRWATNIMATDAEALAYYQSRTNEFVEPEKASVRYVVVPVSNYLAKAEVSDEEVEAYYSEHPLDFMRPAASTNEEDTVIPLEEARGEILARLRQEAAQQLARDAATDLVVALAPGRLGEAPTFEEAAAKLGWLVHTSGLFSKEGPLPVEDADTSFAEAAFRLRPTPEEYFSDALTGSNAVYVLALAERRESHVPPFEAVAEKARARTAKAAETAWRAEQMERLFAAVRDRLASGGTFEDAAKAEGLAVSTTAPFSIYTAPGELDDRDALLEIASRNAGELTRPLQATNGLWLAYVAERKPAEPDAAAVVRSQVQAMLARRRVGLLFSEWERGLLDRMGLRAEMPATAEEESEDLPPIVD